jgi:hypothetical protein
VTKTCKLECGIQFDYHSGGALVAKKYMQPLLPDKWYFNPMAGRCRIGRFRYIARVKCPYRVACKASALRAGKRAPD